MTMLGDFLTLRWLKRDKPERVGEPVPSKLPPIVLARILTHRTKRGGQKGAFGSGSKGPFDSRPALGPGGMRDEYGGEA